MPSSRRPSPTNRFQARCLPCRARRPVLLYQKAYGMRFARSQAEPMTLDTVFDMASVTKVVATATSVMMLVEDGKIPAETTRVATYIPDFGRYGKGRHHDPPPADARVGAPARPRPGRRSVAEPRGSHPRACEERRRRRRASASSTATSTSSSLPRSCRAWRRCVERFVQERLARAPWACATRCSTRRSRSGPGSRPPRCATPYGWPCEGPNQVMLAPASFTDPTARRMGGRGPATPGFFSTAADLAPLLPHGAGWRLRWAHARPFAPRGP